ncbi:MAG: amino acid adenylation domain-containing protein [Nostoc sp.]|uniref:non-ribosomal peptide synthetase n=1 Tax=Nostoc sp. TaxID=1180 RepID=UPI002FFAE89E
MISNKIRNSLTAEDLFSQKIYWLNQISDELPETAFITDYVRPVIFEGKKKSVSFEIPSNLSEKILKLADNSDFSVYLFLVAVLSIYLQKYNGTSDIIVGSPTYKKIKSSEDLLTKLIPLRFNVDNQLTFKDLLIKIKEVAINGYIHQNYSFEKFIELLKLPNNPNRCSFFDIVILLENIHSLEDVIEIPNDLTFSFRINASLIEGSIYYNNSLFLEENVKAIAKYYINILETVINNCSISISDIPVLSELDINNLLQTFNNNTKVYPTNQTIDKLFEKQVEKTPSNFVAVFANTQITYQQLNQKANQLATFLSKLGVRKGDFIGIIKERDINFLIGILAISKVGGVYVPIDSTYPPDRIKYMISNSQVRILLTDSSCLDVLASSQEDCLHLECLICLDIKSNKQAIPVVNSLGNGLINGIKIYDELDFANFSKENLEVNHQGTDPAYMIYTSGSTGLPKGVIIRHGSAINHIYAEFDALGLTENFNFLQTAPASSDISVWQFLAPVLIGGKTIIVGTETICNPENLFQVIKEEKITIVELVPVVLSGLLDYISRLPISETLLPNLKWMMVTGESVSVELVNKWLRMYPSIKVVNAYGPSEAADDITQYIIDKPLPENQRTVPIGKPLANLNIYILDAQMQLLPIGSPGEICVSGFGVAEGYWQNEEMTKSSFVPNPFSTNAKPLPGIQRDLIYKTGDLGRWLPDGNIEFLGRIDHQVKIRGFRIELGEIEMLLSQHPAVGENVVVVTEDSLGDKRLIAYIVPSAEYTDFQDSLAFKIYDSELRNYLKERLPDYMLPSTFMMLESLPLTPSGKLDRRALPQPDYLRPELETTYVMPRNDVERIIAEVWQNILNIKKVGIQDNFFDIGGHSLNILQVYSKLRELLKANLAITDLFKYPTISALSQYFSQEENHDEAFVAESNELNEKLEAGKARFKQRLVQKQRQNIEMV